jgi:peptidoglycan/xylan/chitin deacetylase (PgdA/CDA1 family)
LPRNSVVITFDDGRGDNYDHAYPVLKKYNFPATIFIITQWVGKNPYLTREQIMEMSENRIDFGSHTRHHRHLPDLSEDELRDEIFNSKKDIEAALNKQINHFCYPSGGFTELSKELIREAGYRSATTTNRGAHRDNSDLFELNRIKVSNSDMVRPFNFMIKLSGYYNFFRRGRSGR